MTTSEVFKYAGVDNFNGKVDRLINNKLIVGYAVVDKYEDGYVDVTMINDKEKKYNNVQLLTSGTSNLQISYELKEGDIVVLLSSVGAIDNMAEFEEPLDMTDLEDVFKCPVPYSTPTLKALPLNFTSLNKLKILEDSTISMELGETDDDKANLSLSITPERAISLKLGRSADSGINASMTISDGMDYLYTVSKGDEVQVTSELKADGSARLELKDKYIISVGSDGKTTIEVKGAINMVSDGKITISGKQGVTIKSDAKVEVTGASSFNVLGNFEVSK